MNNEKEFINLINYIDRELPFKSTYYEEKYLKRRIRSRMRRKRLDSFLEYKKILKKNKEERKELLNTFSINVTEFFRNNEVWDKINYLIKKLFDKKKRRSAWSAGCADGREPYSLAILLKKNKKETNNLSKPKVLATDIDEGALEHAKKGIYKESKTDDVSNQLSYLKNYEKYLEKITDNKYRVKKEIRDLTSFEKHDLIKDSAKENEFDLVMCRNLLIYLDSEYKLPIFTTLIKSLKKDGYLVIGKTESLPRKIKQEVETISRKLRIYQKKN